MYFKLDLIFFYIVRYPEAILIETTMTVQQSSHMAGRQIKDQVAPPFPNVRMNTDSVPTSCLLDLQQSALSALPCPGQCTPNFYKHFLNI